MPSGLEGDWGNRHCTHRPPSRTGRVLEELAVNRKQLVRPERFELPTCCSGGNRSIQLSYGRTRIIYSLHGAQGSSNRAQVQDIETHGGRKIPHGRFAPVQITSLRPPVSAYYQRSRPPPPPPRPPRSRPPPPRSPRSRPPPPPPP